jgi:hypothetical protein
MSFLCSIYYDTFENIYYDPLDLLRHVKKKPKDGFLKGDKYFLKNREAGNYKKQNGFKGLTCLQKRIVNITLPANRTHGSKKPHGPASHSLDMSHTDIHIYKYCTFTAINY